MLKLLIIFVLFFVNLGCSTRSNNVAPKVVKAVGVVKGSKVYRVMPHDTLYSIAWAYNCDINELISLNNLSKNSNLHIGQVLDLPDENDIAFKGSLPILHNEKVSKTNINQPKLIKNKLSKKSDYIVIKQNKLQKFNGWSWPNAKYKFSQAPWRGVWVFANQVNSIAPGVVVYDGSGIKGYGHLIIIKHSKGYLSAYGNVLRSQIKLGQKIKVKQLIAYSNKRFYVEIRKNGKALNLKQYFK